MSHGRPPQMLFKTHLFTCSLVHQVGGGRLAWSQWSGMVSSVKRFENERFLERKPSWKLTKRWAVHQPETRVWPALIRAGNSSKSRWSQLVREIAFYILQLWLRTFRAGGACLFSLPHNIPSSQPLKEQKSRCRNENSPGQDWTQIKLLFRRKLDSTHCNTRLRIRITPHNSRSTHSSAEKYPRTRWSKLTFFGMRRNMVQPQAGPHEEVEVGCIKFVTFLHVYIRLF